MYSDVWEHLFLMKSKRRGTTFCNILFASPSNENLCKCGLLLKERICSSRSKFFPLRDDPLVKGGKNENHIVASPESVSIHLEKHVVKLLSQTDGVTIIIAYVGSINSYPFLKGVYPFLFNIFNMSM